MRTTRGNAKVIVLVSVTLAGLITGPMAHTAAAIPAAATSAKADVRGVVVRIADDGVERTALRIPGMRYVPVTGSALDLVAAGTQVEAEVEMPQTVIDAARAQSDVPADGGGQVHLDRGQLAEAASAGSAPAGSPLAQATVAEATSSGQTLTTSGVTVLAAAASGYTRARHLVTVAVVTPRGVTGTPATQAQIRTQIANTSTYWSEQSNGGITFAATRISTPYISAHACGADPFKVWNEAAQRTGFVEGPNKHLLLSFPKSATGKKCPYGLASIGSGVNSGGVAIVSDTAWPVLAHEIGHNLGLGHAQSLQCTRTDADLRKLPAGCKIVDYGYPWSVMARSATDRAGALSTLQATRIGLLQGGDIVEVKAGARTVTLNAVSTFTGLRSLRVIDPISREAYYVEYRTRTGRDRLLYENVPNGVRILKVDARPGEQHGSVVLDMTPTGSQKDNLRQLDAGKTFTSHTGGVSIRVNTAATTASVTATAGGASARPRPGSPALFAPTVTVPAVNTTSATTASATVSWAGAPSGARYDVRFRTVGADAAGRATYGRSTTWLSGTARRHGVLTGSYGGVYQVSARVRSGAATGEWSNWRTTALALDAGARGASTSGRWQTLRGSAYYARTVLATSTNGAALQRPATPATNVKLVGTRHARGSIARVYVDGRLRTTVDTYAARTSHRQVLANISVPAGTHVVRVVNVASKARPTLLLDALAYTR